MKTTKRIFACLLIVVMLASMLCIGASAAVTPDATITINGAVGTTYTAYKVLNIEATTSGSTVTAILYTWADPSYADATTYEVITTDDSGKSYVSIADGQVVNFANDMLKAGITEAATATITTGSTVDMTITDADGYYVMKSSANTIPFAFTICNGKIVTPTNGDVSYIETTTITEKTELPAITKTVDKANANIGETVTYTTEITAKVGALNYVLHDAAEAGITIDTTSIVVAKNGTPVGAGTTTFSVKTASICTDCDFHIEFAQAFCDTLKTGDKVTVTYTGKLNAGAEISGETNTNTAWLIHGATGNLKVDEQKANVTTYQLTVNKTDGTNPLAGATFSLYSDEACNNVVSFDTVSANVYVLNTTSGSVTTFTTDDTGSFILKGLYGNYWLKETDAPAGYKINTEKTSVTLDKNVETTITNTAGNPLPETGGMGTTVFYAAGGILVLGALVVLLMKKRTVTE